MKLEGQVAVVAGATRGAGRGIARGLGEAGATVYCTGRSVSGRRSSYDRPETIEETAEMVNAAGGTGIPVQVDHTDQGQVRALFERVDREQGRLDVLADSVAGEDPSFGGWTRLWETDLADLDTAMRAAVHSRLITARHAAPLMIRQKRGLIVEVTEMDLLFSSGNVIAQLARSAVKGLALILAAELREHGVTAVALTPGFLRSETMLEHFKVTEDSWRDGAKQDPDFIHSESPLYVGRAVVALAADENSIDRTGGVTSTWELSRVYGFDDYDGRRPDFGRHFTEVVVPNLSWFREGMERHRDWLEALAGRARDYLGKAD